MKSKIKYESISGIDLAGKTVVVTGYRDSLGIFTCSGGFGCNPTALGRKIYGTWASDKTNDEITRGAVVRIATEEDLKSVDEFFAKPEKERWLITNVDVFANGIDAKIRELDEQNQKKKK